MDFATQLRVMRLVRGLSQVDLSERTGIASSYISFIETGKMIPTPEMETAIKSALRWPANADQAFAILEGEEAA